MDASTNDSGYFGLSGSNLKLNEAACSASHRRSVDHVCYQSGGTFSVKLFVLSVSWFVHLLLQLRFTQNFSDAAFTVVDKVCVDKLRFEKLG